MIDKEYISCYDCAYRGEFIENPREDQIPPIVDARFVYRWILCHCPVPFYTRGLLVPYIMYEFRPDNNMHICSEPLQHHCDKYMKADICPVCELPMVALNSFGCSNCGYIIPEDFIKEKELSV